jgi:Xaa-Pro aminopeptidase
MVIRYCLPTKAFTQFQQKSPDSSLVLSPGMTLTVEPGIYVPEHQAVVRIENNILITANGYKMLSDYSIEIDGK